MAISSKLTFGLEEFPHGRESGNESKRRLTWGICPQFIAVHIENYLETDRLLIGALNPSHSSGVKVFRSTFSNRPL